MRWIIYRRLCWHGQPKTACAHSLPGRFCRLQLYVATCSRCLSAQCPVDAGRIHSESLAICGFQEKKNKLCVISTRSTLPFKVHAVSIMQMSIRTSRLETANLCVNFRMHSWNSLYLFLRRVSPLRLPVLFHWLSLSIASKSTGVYSTEGGI